MNDILIRNNVEFPYTYELNIFIEDLNDYIFYQDNPYNHFHINNNVYFQLEDILNNPFKGIIAIGKSLDVYNPQLNTSFLLTRIIKLLIKYRIPLVIYTRNNWVLNDLEYLKDLGDLTYCCINSVICCSNLELEKIVDETSVSYKQKIDMLKTFKEKTNCVCGCTIDPIIPFVLDNEENLKPIFDDCKRINIDFIDYNIFKVNKDNRDIILRYTESKIPFYYDMIFHLIKRGRLSNEYKAMFVLQIKKLYKEYNLNVQSYQLYQEKILGIKKLDLF